MEFTVRLFRALANVYRLRILRVLALSGEQSVGAVEEAVRIGRPQVSEELRVLTAAGLVSPRRSEMIARRARPVASTVVPPG